jgi:hypothetical protein
MSEFIRVDFGMSASYLFGVDPELAAARFLPVEGIGS